MRARKKSCAPPNATPLRPKKSRVGRTTTRAAQKAGPEPPKHDCSAAKRRPFAARTHVGAGKNHRGGEENDLVTQLSTSRRRNDAHVGHHPSRVTHSFHRKVQMHATQRRKDESS